MSRVPFVDLVRDHAPLAEALRAAIDRVVASGRYILGPEVETFERALAERCGARHAVGVSSGTDALLLALRAVGVRPGDGVIVPSFTFVATVEAVVRVGAIPVYADVGPDLGLTAQTCVEALSMARGRGLRVGACVAVHLYGIAVNVPEVRAALGTEVPIVEDAAQALGARLGESPVGKLGDAAAFSFFPTKVLGGMGDGGAVLGERAIAEVARRLRQHGFDAERRDVGELGYNARLDALQAALLSVKLRHIDRSLAARRAHAARYRAAFASLGVEVVGCEARHDEHAWGVFTIRTASREALRSHLSACGVSSAIYYRRGVHRMQRYRSADDLPATDDACREVLSLPCFPSLTDDEIERVIASVTAFYRR